MTARFNFKVGPANRNSDYAQHITVLAESFVEAREKAIAFRGFKPRDSSTWLLSVEEISPDTEILERLAKLISEQEKD